MTTDAERRARNVAVVERYLEIIGTLDLDALPSILHEEADLVLPYAPPGIPGVISGKEAFVNWMNAMPGMLSPLNFKASRVDTLGSDPDEVVAEYTGDATNLANGKPYRNTYIARVRMKDGLIVRYAEWFNPLVFNEAFGEVAVEA